MKLLKDAVRERIKKTRTPLTEISAAADVPYSALYHFVKSGKDMRSEYMQRIYESLTDKPLLNETSNN